jgi:PsbP
MLLLLLSTDSREDCSLGGAIKQTTVADHRQSPPKKMGCVLVMSQRPMLLLSPDVSATQVAITTTIRFRLDLSRSDVEDPAMAAAELGTQPGPLRETAKTRAGRRQDGVRRCITVAVGLGFASFFDFSGRMPVHSTMAATAERTSWSLQRSCFLNGWTRVRSSENAIFLSNGVRQHGRQSFQSPSAESPGFIRTPFSDSGVPLFSATPPPLEALQSASTCTDASSQPSRRQIVRSGVASVILSLVGPSSSSRVRAAIVESDENNVLKRSTKDFAYEFAIPTSSNSFQLSNKPVKTHLEEINVTNDQYKGYQYGITVDPVRISSMSEFGTPEQVAAKVVLAEVNRDGVFDVTLMKDPVQVAGNDEASALILNYRSSGTRGDKRFVVKFSIFRNKLYALTCQCLEADYATLSKEINQAVDSFRIPVASFLSA